MNSPPPKPQAARATRLERFRRLLAAIRRHPVRAALVLPALMLLYVLALIPFTPGVGDLRRAKSATPSVVMSSDGVVLAEFKRPDRRWVTLDHIAPSVVDALIATEDRRFYDHHGIDVRRTVAALLSTLTGDLQGGSTLTQQLARNLYSDEIGRKVTLTRKIKEAITALKIEALYTKREILETYLNTVPFLFNAFGIELAARTYFGKPAERIDVLEAATLVGMLKATSANNPLRHPERALERRNLVLGQMAKYGKLTTAQFDALSKRPLRLNFERQPVPPSPVPHIVRHLRDWLMEWAGERHYYDGLVVRTTIDSRLQAAANKAVARQMAQLQKLAGGERRGGHARDVLQVGFMAMDPRNGYVRAWVGGRDFAKEEFDQVSQARRQPGSAFKPFVYAAAFTAGYRSTSLFMDAPVSVPLEGGGYWEPHDVSAPSGRAMTLRDGLVYSKNTITAQLVHQVGPKRVMNLAWAMGVRESKLDPVLSLALGTSPVTLQEMVGAYGTIANMGHFVQPTIVSRIEDREGRVLAEFDPQPEAVPAMSAAPALELLNAMRGVVKEGTGAAIRKRYGITADVAGKTGTTQENHDAWFIMMHPQLVAGVRVGFNEKRNMGTWGTGARSALPMVADVFQEALRNHWIDSRAEFGTPRLAAIPAYQRMRDRTPGWSLPEVFDDVRQRLRKLFR
ncbi:MAG: glycosyl transferase, family 51 [Betaproteobacteria bacterium]|nr:glycosyl transferase, family 51 [Betaproteobacteria bacterium]